MAEQESNMECIYCISDLEKVFDAYIIADSEEMALEIARSDVDIHYEKQLIVSEVNVVNTHDIYTKIEQLDDGFIDDELIRNELRNILSKQNNNYMR